MKILIILTLLLSGCATTEMTYTGADGSTIAWKSTTYLKKVTDAQASWGTASVSLGASSPDMETIIAVSQMLNAGLLKTP